MVDRTPKQKRRRAKKPMLCDHGYPAIPDPRGCAACWTKHPGYVKQEPKERKPTKDIRQVTCEKCFLPAQTGSPPLVRLASAEAAPAKYEHRPCPSDTTGGATLPRAKRRSFRRTLTASLRSHMRKMIRIEHSRRDRVRVLRVATAREERLLAAKETENVA